MHSIRQAHKWGEIMAVDFNPINTHVLATAGKDGTAGLWNMRMIQCRFHSLECYEADPEGGEEKNEKEMEVNSLSWSNASESLSLIHI